LGLNVLAGTGAYCDASSLPHTNVMFILLVH
jgi:hypothetical protein